MSLLRLERTISHDANADLSAKRYFAVKLLTTDKVDLADSAAVGYGILQNQPKSGESALVGRSGYSKVVTDGSGTAIAIGDFLKANAAGKLVKATVDKDRVLARALAASTADGTIIAAELVTFDLAV